MIVFPLAATGVSLVFAAMLLRRYAATHRHYQALWAIALLMFAAASFALVLGVLNGWTTAEFRVYWVFGAVLTVPYLAMGELYLLVPSRLANALMMLALLAGTAVALGTVRTAVLHTAALAKDLPLGKDVFGAGSGPHRFAQWYGYPAYGVLVGGTLWSAMRIRGQAALRERFLGTLLIAAGSTIVFIGSGIGAGVLGSFVFFSVTLAGGVVVMFLGFLRASHRPAAEDVAEPGESG